jgi:hypothetical protein
VSQPAGWRQSGGEWRRRGECGGRMDEIVDGATDRPVLTHSVPGLHHSDNSDSIITAESGPDCSHTHCLSSALTILAAAALCKTALYKLTSLYWRAYRMSYLL